MGSASYCYKKGFSIGFMTAKRSMEKALTVNPLRRHSI